MNAAECLERAEELARFLELEMPIEVKELEELGPHVYSIAGRVALPCLPAGRFGGAQGSSGNSILDIPIFVDDQEIGFLCLSSKLGESGIQPNVATDTQKHAIIRLASQEDFDAGAMSMTRLDSDCVVIDSAHAERFLRDSATSAVWGGFVLQADATPLEKCVESADEAKIIVASLAPPRTHRHRAALQRATESPIVVDRFLHSYHFLELDYDHEIVERIKAVDPENTSGLEKLLGTGRSELERLFLVTEEFSQIDELERVASALRNHREAALTVFYDYGKEQNPLKERDAFERQFIDSPAINRQTLDDIKKRDSLSLDFTKNDDSYLRMLVRLACYWTYRIRCCIAHNKLGEYHLRTAADMKFVGEFGEPLIRSLIVHRLKV